ncbi:unnamed protein product [Paramecium pentaurelia]|uniref:Mitogen-activated protein kinase n=1 Tax=Paramecium pentaurelia TaxID=43138 RepID=A0A8S1TXP9_9CILI|nr:unnamed protein product [Paramecium pentaurelia]
MDPEEKQLIGSILSDESEVRICERKQPRKKSKLSLNAKEFQPTLINSIEQIEILGDNHGNDTLTYNSTNTQPYIINERQKQKKSSIKIHHDLKQLQFSPKKHQTMQPISQVQTYFLTFNSHPSLQEDNQVQLQLSLEQICGNQNASRNLQKIFDNGTPLQRSMIFETIEKNLIKTSKDLFGNYLVQKIFLSGEKQWKFSLFYQLKGHFVELSKNQYASRVINRMIEFLKDEDNHLEIEFIDEIKYQIRQLINDNNGCFVLLSCLENFDEKICEYMKKHIEQSVYSMSQHTYGCRIIQFMLQKQNSQSLLDQIMDVSQQLCICEFGNYIIQFILKSNFKQQKMELFRIIKSNFQTLSYNKYGSNVVEVFLEIIEQEDIKFVTNIMLNVDQENNYLFVAFATHPFGNYVFKKYLQLDQQYIIPVLGIIKRHPELLQQINTSEYGQKIFSVYTLPNQIVQYYSPFRSNAQKTVIQDGENTFVIDPQYQYLSIIGQGSYGVVFAAKDTKKDQGRDLVAIKKIVKAFEQRLFAKRTLRELRLQRLFSHENVISIEKIMLPKSREEFDDIYIVQELMETDLSTIIRQQTQLDQDQICFLLYQLLRGLKYIHSANVVHRDLKPKNLLINGNCDLKICDFGLARALDPQIKLKPKVYSPYVQTRWYRAPELLLQWRDYNQSIDMWSVGCIFAEMLRKKIFLPGASAKNQIELIFDVLGSPNEQVLQMAPKSPLSISVNQMQKKRGRDFEKLFPNGSKEAIDLLRQLFEYDPTKRITAEQALRHPYLSKYHIPEDEPIAVPVRYLDFEFEEYNLTIEQWKDCIYEEILLYHYPEFSKDYELNIKKGYSIMKHIINNDNAKQLDQILDEDEEDEDDDLPQNQQIQ